MNFQSLVLCPEHHVLRSMAPEWDSYEWWRTEWLCVFLLPASLISTACQCRSISLQRPGLCCYFFLKLCACTSGEVQRAFEDAIQFPTLTSTVVCLLLFLAKRRGGFSLKAWSFSCFCVITEHKVKSPPLSLFVSVADIPLFFLWGNILPFPGLKDCYWSDHFLFSCHREMAHSLFLKCFIGQSCGNKMLIFFPAGWQRCIHLWTCLGVMSPWRSVFLRSAPASVVLVGAPKQYVFTFKC